MKNYLPLAPVGQALKILNVVNQPFLIARRLGQLGFCEDESLKIIQKSALKKTILIEILGGVICLRSSVAMQVEVVW